MNDKVRIKIGSKNKAKIEAVGEILKEYPHLAHAKLEIARGMLFKFPYERYISRIRFVVIIVFRFPTDNPATGHLEPE